MTPAYTLGAGIGQSIAEAAAHGTNPYIIAIAAFLAATVLSYLICLWRTK